MGKTCFFRLFAVMTILIFFVPTTQASAQCLEPPVGTKLYSNEAEAQKDNPELSVAEVVAGDVGALSLGPYCGEQYNTVRLIAREGMPLYWYKLPMVPIPTLVNPETTGAVNKDEFRLPSAESVMQALNPPSFPIGWLACSLVICGLGWRLFKSLSKDTKNYSEDLNFTFHSTEPNGDRIEHQRLITVTIENISTKAGAALRQENQRPAAFKTLFSNIYERVRGPLEELSVKEADRQGNTILQKVLEDIHDFYRENEFGHRLREAKLGEARFDETTEGFQRAGLKAEAHRRYAKALTGSKDPGLVEFIEAAMMQISDRQGGTSSDELARTPAKENSNKEEK